jgi:hypothetical protein
MPSWRAEARRGSRSGRGGWRGYNGVRVWRRDESEPLAMDRFEGDLLLIGIRVG